MSMLTGQLRKEIYDIIREAIDDALGEILTGGETFGEPDTTENAINVIHPYEYHGTLVFDDASRGLNKEAFVSGADTLLRGLTQEVFGEPVSEFRLLFSSEPFPHHQRSFTRMAQEHGGWWYVEDGTGAEGWLCPALFKYFLIAPEQIFVRVERVDGKPIHSGRKV